MEKRILRNSIITPDGTELVSRFTHDYVQHEDLNKELYINDGYKGIYVDTLKEELEYRAKNNIFVED
jgi:hypothetical protein